MPDPDLTAEEPRGLIHLGVALDYLEFVPTYETSLGFTPRPFDPEKGGCITLICEDVIRRPSKATNVDMMFVRFISARGDLSFKSFPLSGVRQDARPNVLGVIDLLGASGMPTYDILELVQKEWVEFEEIARFIRGERIGAKLQVREYSGQKVYEIERLMRAEWLRDTEIEQIVSARLSEELAVQKMALASALFRRGYGTLAHEIEVGGFDKELQERV